MPVRLGRSQDDIVHDAASSSSQGTGELFWTHTPNISTPKGILVLVAQDYSVSIADQVSTVSYGGKAMTRVGRVAVNGQVAAYAYWLTDFIPRGAAAVQVQVSGSTKKRAVCISIAGGTHTPLKPVVKSVTGIGSTAPALTGEIQYEQQIVYSLLMGTTNPAPGAAMTEILENLFEAAVYAQWDRNNEPIYNGDTPKAQYGTQTSGSNGGFVISIGARRDFGVVTALPTANAGIGDTCKLRVAEGTYWDLVYTAEETYPWTKVGGPPLFKNATGIISTSAETKLTTGMPSITLPALKMEADVRFGAAGGLMAVSGSQAKMWLSIAGAYAETWDRTTLATITGATGGAGLGARYRGVFTSGQVVGTAVSRVVGSGEIQVLGPYLEIDPIRVG